MFEQALIELLSQFLRTEAGRLADDIRRRGPAVFQDATVWFEHQQRLLSILTPALEALAAKGVEAVVRTIGASDVAVNWDLVNRQAVEWAREHAGKLVTRVSDTTRSMVGEQVAQWSKSGETLPDLADRIAGLTNDEGLPIFNHQRAELIASTEATTAFASANAKAWSAAGYAQAIFHPAAHPRCRCYIQPYVLPDGSKVLVWYTARDELVCTRTIKTPWGPVAGCQALHKVIVSAGPYLGKKLEDVK